MKAGFVTALGTPLDKEGNLIVESYRKEIEDQINAGAVGLLAMGSMGQQAFIREEICVQVAKTAVETAADRVPVFVGAMDCGINRAKKRLASMEDIEVTGFVFTTPYYHPCTKDQIMNYFKAVAACTKHQILLYDLPVVTQSKISYDMVLELIREVPNLAGIKSADQQMFRKLKLNAQVPKEFLMVYSGLDTFDVAYKWGIDHCLDGMMACTPTNSGKLFAAMAEGDYEAAADYLNNIVGLRDFFVAHDLWPSFSVAMNLLGCEGNFAPDYISPLKEGYMAEIRNELIRIGELS